jgi:two-component system chemotaxis response regulator CheY
MPEPHTPRRVLVVDDGTLVRLFYRKALEAQVEEAINGIEALEKLLSVPVDLVIVDINMPKMDGVAFLRALRSQPGATAAIPALVISSEAADRDAAAARVAGANYYRVKPVTEADLALYAAVLAGRSA